MRLVYDHEKDFLPHSKDKLMNISSSEVLKNEKIYGLRLDMLKIKSMDQYTTLTAYSIQY